MSHDISTIKNDPDELLKLWLKKKGVKKIKNETGVEKKEKEVDYTLGLED